jgi:hypothetical protein
MVPFRTEAAAITLWGLVKGGQVALEYFRSDTPQLAAGSLASLKTFITQKNIPQIIAMIGFCLPVLVDRSQE